MSLILTNREKQKIKVDIGSIVNYNQEDIDYFNTITEIKLKNGHILEVLETEEQIEKMIYQYHNSDRKKKMRKTREKQKSDFIEVKILEKKYVIDSYGTKHFKEYVEKKILIRKSEIRRIEENGIHLTDCTCYTIYSTEFDSIKEKLGL